jgi:hypothetical protein
VGRETSPVAIKETGMAIISDIQVSKNSWFSNDVIKALTDSFVEFEFGFASFSITVFNDAESGWIEYSFDGLNANGRVMPGETRKMDFCRHGAIWLRGESGAEPYRSEVY